MSAVAAPARQLSLGGARTLAERRGSGPLRQEQSGRSSGGGLTLGQQLDGVLEGLLAAGAADCLVCGERMERSGAGGRCGGCGTTVS